MEFQISAQAESIRLDQYLRNQLAWLSRAELSEYIAAQNVARENVPLKKGSKLYPGDRIMCRNIPPATLIPNSDIPLQILYEDETLLAVDKPAGVPTHPLRHAETNTLINALLARYPALAHIGPHPLFPAVLHRLDTHTSGLVLVAKTTETYEDLRRQFQRLHIEKEYIARVHGHVEAPGLCDRPLVHQTKQPCKMKAIDSAQAADFGGDVFPATTHWRPLGYNAAENCTLVSAIIFSGVTHQIRCHLAHAGFPIVGDTRYGSPRADLPRHYLHASRCRFTHPDTHREMVVHCAPPADGWCREAESCEGA